MTIYIHCGAHKTASTFLQRWLKVNRNVLEKRLVSFHIKPFLDLPVFTAKDIINICQKDYYNKWQKIILSDENFIGAMPGIVNKHENNFFTEKSISRFSCIVQEIKNKFPCKILLYVRRQDSYLESCYRFRKKMGAKYNFNQFLELTSTLNISWYNIADQLANQVGKDNCIVIPYETIKISQKEFLLFFCEHLLNLSQEEDMKIPQPTNTSLSDLSMDIIDYLDNQLPNITKNQKLDIISIIENHQNKDKKRCKKISLFSEKQRNQIIDKYLNDNRKLFAKFINNFPDNFYESEICN